MLRPCSYNIYRTLRDYYKAPLDLLLNVRRIMDLSIEDIKIFDEKRKIKMPELTYQKKIKFVRKWINSTSRDVRAGESNRHKELREKAREWLRERGYTIIVDEYRCNGGNNNHYIYVDIVGLKEKDLIKVYNEQKCGIGVECGNVPKKRIDFLEKYFDKVVVFPHKKKE